VQEPVLGIPPLIGVPALVCRYKVSTADVEDTSVDLSVVSMVNYIEYNINDPLPPWL